MPAWTGNDDYYDEDSFVWIGPGWYGGVWFGSEDDFNNGTMAAAPTAMKSMADPAEARVAKAAAAATPARP